MWNWNDICIKYHSYQLANDYGAMQGILDQIKAYFNVSTNAAALQYIVENCNRWFPNFHWELPQSPEAQIDCYDCRAQIMQRYMASVGCPQGWIASPVNASTLTSKNPCDQRNKLAPRFGDVKFYDTSTGRSIGDATLSRRGSLKAAAAKKIGSHMPAPAASQYKRLRQNGNGTTLSKGYPMNKKGIVNPQHLSKGFPINERGIVDRKGMNSKGYNINKRGIKG